MKKKHPHKRAVSAEERKELRGQNQQWWGKKGAVK